MSRSASLLEKGAARPANDRPPDAADARGDTAVLSITIAGKVAARLDAVAPSQADGLEVDVLDADILEADVLEADVLEADVLEADVLEAALALAPAGNRRLAFLAIKRAIDVVGAAMLLVVLSPVMLVTWLVLVWTTRGQPIFVQERIGFLGRPFRMYKFRTMVLDAAARQSDVENHQDGPIFKNFRDPRITPIGRLLRSLSIDETPQLFNVLAGQMSLVGPRPAVAKEVMQYEAWQRARLAVKPGLTCLWQVSGRSEIGFDEWMRMDAWYVRHQSLWVDLTLLARTPWSVLSRRGAY